MGVRTIAYPPSTASKQQLAAISPSASSLSSQSGIVAGSRQRSVRSSPTASLLCSQRSGRDARAAVSVGVKRVRSEADCLGSARREHVERVLVRGAGLARLRLDRVGPTRPS